MTERCVVRFTVTSSATAPMTDMRSKAGRLLESLDAHAHWDMKWDIVTETVGSWVAHVTAYMVNNPRPEPPEHPEPPDRPERPPRGPR